MGLNSEMFSSQMNFLGAYADAFFNRREKAKAIQDKLDKLKPVLQEAETLEEELNELHKANREDEKFLMNMNNTVEKSLGITINNGPLFNNESGENREQNDGKN